MAQFYSQSLNERNNKIMLNIGLWNSEAVGLRIFCTCRNSSSFSSSIQAEKQSHKTRNVNLRMCYEQNHRSTVAVSIEVRISQAPGLWVRSESGFRAGIDSAVIEIGCLFSLDCCRQSKGGLLRERDDDCWPRPYLESLWFVQVFRRLSIIQQAWRHMVSVSATAQQVLYHHSSSKSISLTMV